MARQDFPEPHSSPAQSLSLSRAIPNRKTPWCGDKGSSAEWVEGMKDQSTAPGLFVSCLCVLGRPKATHYPPSLPAPRPPPWPSAHRRLCLLRLLCSLAFAEVFQEADAISLLASQESSQPADLQRGHNTDLLLPLSTQTEFMSREKVRDHLIL